MPVHPSKIELLVITDCDSWRQACAEQLAPEFHNVHLCHDLAAALHLLSNSAVDLVLCDDQLATADSDDWQKLANAGVGIVLCSSQQVAGVVFKRIEQQSYHCLQHANVPMLLSVLSETLTKVRSCTVDHNPHWPTNQSDKPLTLPLPVINFSSVANHLHSTY